MNALTLRFAALFCILTALSGCATTRKSGSSSKTSSEAPAPASFITPTLVPRVAPDLLTPVYHVVKPRETLWRISKTYGVPLRSIMDTNQIKDQTKIKVGQSLLIPGAQAVMAPIPLYTDRGRWRYIVIHHTATDQGDATYIDRLHQRRGWSNGLGYHFLIDNGTLGHRVGEVEVGKRWFRQMDGAHANKSNMNHIGIGIALVGNFSEASVSEEQLRSLAQLVRTLMRQYHIPARNILGHRMVPGAATECPGTRFPWDRFLQMI